MFASILYYFQKLADQSEQVPVCQELGRAPVGNLASFLIHKYYLDHR